MHTKNFSLYLTAALVTLSIVVPGLAQVKSVVTDESLDLVNTQATPPEPLDKCYSVAFVKNWDAAEAFKHTLGLRPGLVVGGAWRSAQTVEKTIYFKVAFATPLNIGSMVMTPIQYESPDEGNMMYNPKGQPNVFVTNTRDPHVTLSFLKQGVPGTGDVKNDDQWEEVKSVEQASHLRLTVFPPNTRTRAVRIRVNTPYTLGGKWQGSIVFMQLYKARLFNIVPEAQKIQASSQKDKHGWPWMPSYDSDADQIISGGRYWVANPDEDISDENPQWLLLNWDKTQSIVGFIAVNPVYWTSHYYTLKAGVADLGAAQEKDWAKAADTSHGPSYRCPYFDFRSLSKATTTTALKVVITQPYCAENEDIVAATGGGKRTAALDNLLVFVDLGDKPVPSQNQ